MYLRAGRRQYGDGGPRDVLFNDRDGQEGQNKINYPSCPILLFQPIDPRPASWCNLREVFFHK